MGEAARRRRINEENFLSGEAPVTNSHDGKAWRKREKELKAAAEWKPVKKKDDGEVDGTQE